MPFISMFYTLGVILSLGLSLMPIALHAQPLAEKSHLKQQRLLFQQARDAQNQNDLAQLEMLRAQLKGYPLLPYLNLWQGYALLDQGDDFAISQLLDTYSTIPESLELRIAWINDLAKRGQWPHVAAQLAQLDNINRVDDDILLRAAWYNDQPEQALSQLTQRWQHGETLPDDIPRLTAAWKAEGHPNHDDLWTRMIFHIKRQQWDQVEPLKHRLPLHEQAWVETWKAIQQQPEAALLTTQNMEISPQIMAYMARDGLRRLTSKEPEVAWHTLQIITPRLNRDDTAKLQRMIAIRAAKQHNTQADQWLASIPSSHQTKQSHAWLIRLLLLKKEWQQALQVIQSMPESEQLETRWIYWQGYLLEKLNHREIANHFFEQAALERGYYGFLSANHLALPYQMGDIPRDTPSTQEMEDRPAMQRAFEWRELGEDGKASREWHTALQGASEAEWKQAMQLSIQWQWHEQTIRAASKSRQRHALHARFPLAYQDVVHRMARQKKLRSSLIWGVIRQESAFNAQARSATGARGLMQLMPRTATYVAKKHQLPHRDIDLTSAKENIQLGSSYLADLLQRFDQREAIAIAAYNAGPTRVSRWQASMDVEDMELWVELLPYRETRLYVQHVLAFMMVYDWLQQKPATPILNKPKT